MEVIGMSLLKNRFYLAIVAVAVLLVCCYLCCASVMWIMMFCVLAPMLLGYVLRRFIEEHDYTDEIEDADWQSDEY